MFHGEVDELARPVAGIGLNGGAPKLLTGVADGRALEGGRVDGRAGFAEVPQVPLFAGFFARPFFHHSHDHHN